MYEDTNSYGGEMTPRDLQRQLEVLSDAFSLTGGYTEMEFAKAMGYTKAEQRGFAAGLGYAAKMAGNGWEPLGLHMGKAMDYLAGKMCHVSLDCMFGDPVGEIEDFSEVGEDA